MVMCLPIVHVSSLSLNLDSMGTHACSVTCDLCHLLSVKVTGGQDFFDNSTLLQLSLVQLTWSLYAKRSNLFHGLKKY